MRDAGNDDQDDVGNDFRWLSYGELGQARGISTASAIRLAFRRKWRRQDGNDGTVRVAVPVDEAKPQGEVADSHGDGVGRDIGQVVGLLETAATMLRERGEAADGMLAALHANAEEALARAEAATATEREARRRAEVATADAEAQLAQFREDLERVSRDGEARSQRRRLPESRPRQRRRSSGRKIRPAGTAACWRDCARPFGRSELLLSVRPSRTLGGCRLLVRAADRVEHSESGMIRIAMTYRLCSLPGFETLSTSEVATR